MKIYTHREGKEIDAPLITDTASPPSVVDNVVDNVETVSSPNAEDNTESKLPPNYADIDNYDPHQHRNVPNPTS